MILIEHRNITYAPNIKSIQFFFYIQNAGKTIWDRIILQNIFYCVI